jgi:hypothetical protein
MAAVLVVDASVALKWLQPEADSEAALGLIGRAILAAPELMMVEAANALATRVRRRELSPLEARTSVTDLHGIHIDFIANRDLAPAALSLGPISVNRSTTASTWPWLSTGPRSPSPPIVASCRRSLRIPIWLEE